MASAQLLSLVDYAAYVAGCTDALAYMVRAGPQQSPAAAKDILISFLSC